MAQAKRVRSTIIFEHDGVGILEMDADYCRAFAIGESVTFIDDVHCTKLGPYIVESIACILSYIPTPYGLKPGAWYTVTVSVSDGAPLPSTALRAPKA